MRTIAATRRLPAAVEAAAAAQFDFLPNACDLAWTRADFQSCRAVAIIPTVTDRIDAAVIASLDPCVRLLANFGAGVSHIDVAAARARGIAVTNTPDVLTEATADIAMLLLIGAARRAGEGEAMMRARTWRGWAPTEMLGTDLGGKTLGIYGLGRIGAAVARRALAFGMTVIYRARRAREPAGLLAEFVADDADFWPRCQFLSLHAPLTEETHGLVGPRVIEALPNGAVIVNTARGELVDDDALVAALASGRVAAAGLDVFAGEPAFDPRYAALANTFLLPHLGSATQETRTAMGFRALANAAAFLQCGFPPDRVV